ncbi:hypothetical protein [Paraflavitalea speifideaquila]|uniref:hypothetical protein n=1 Tax=Paraflavitalea speifideaquila TaxID=3076558 RepID=UPI0028EE5337|nr:hypothetical protein [Paraflavitalea speifideiaquila]
MILSGKHSLVNVTVADDFEKLYGAEVVSTPEEIFYFKFSRLGSNQGFHYVMYAHYPGSGYFPPGGFLYQLQRFGGNTHYEKLGPQRPAVYLQLVS